MVDEAIIGDRPRFTGAVHNPFRPYGELLSLCSRERESNQRESAPGIRVSLRSTPLPPALFRGSSRWAIPGPSFLVWHPCQTPLSTAPPLGLLTGSKTESPELSAQKKTKRKKQGPSTAALPQCLGSFGFWYTNLADDAKRPVRRPSGIVV